MPYIETIRNMFTPFGGLVRLGYNATGGSITVAGGYRTHTFSYTGSSQTFIADGVGTVEYLILAGGGAGAAQFNQYYEAAGAGGAGGLIYSSVEVTPQNYSIVVGAGGTSSDSTGPGSETSTKGTNSVALGFTAFGGGVGLQGYESLIAGRQNGGSAGSHMSTDPGVTAGVAGQGNAGGARSGASINSFSGGGGGAGSAGANATSGRGGDGGAGLANSITGSSVTYAGGGGGSKDSTGAGSYGSGGSGGGGNGGQGNATNGRGGGGGCGIQDGSSISTNKRGGSGGHGVVIIRYPV
jgi:hypothetical protein